jgi:hypothetical protein
MLLRFRVARCCAPAARSHRLALVHRYQQLSTGKSCRSTENAPRRVVPVGGNAAAKFAADGWQFVALRTEIEPSQSLPTVAILKAKRRLTPLPSTGGWGRPTGAPSELALQLGARRHSTPATRWNVKRHRRPVTVRCWASPAANNPTPCAQFPPVPACAL